MKPCCDKYKGPLLGWCEDKAHGWVPYPFPKDVDPTIFAGDVCKTCGKLRFDDTAFTCSSGFHHTDAQRAQCATATAEAYYEEREQLFKENTRLKNAIKIAQEFITARLDDDVYAHLLVIFDVAVKGK